MLAFVFFKQCNNSRFAAAALAKRCNCLTPPPFANAKLRDRSSSANPNMRGSTYHLDCELVFPGGVDGVSRVVYGLTFEVWKFARCVSALGASLPAFEA